MAKSRQAHSVLLLRLELKGKTEKETDLAQYKETLLTKYNSQPQNYFSFFHFFFFFLQSSELPSLLRQPHPATLLLPRIQHHSYARLHATPHTWSHGSHASTTPGVLFHF